MQPNDVTGNGELTKDRHNDTKSKSTTTTATLCVDGWKSFNSKCYKYVPFESSCNVMSSSPCTKRVNWPEAKDYCISIAPNISQSVGDISADLASVPDENTNNFLKELTQDKAWIGGYRDSTTSNQWKWSDGTPMVYQSWASGQPTADSVNMVINYRRYNQGPYGLWDDQLSNVKGFFCQYYCEFKYRPPQA